MSLSVGRSLSRGVSIQSSLFTEGSLSRGGSLSGTHPTAMHSCFYFPIKARSRNYDFWPFVYHQVVSLILQYVVQDTMVQVVVTVLCVRKHDQNGTR